MLENADDAAVDAAEPDEAVDALEFVLESMVSGYSDLAVTGICCWAICHLRDLWEKLGILPGSISSRTADRGRWRGRGRRGIKCDVGKVG